MKSVYGTVRQQTLLITTKHMIESSKSARACRAIIAAPNRGLRPVRRPGGERCARASQPGVLTLKYKILS
jgi:hypothetical protein